MRIAVIDEVLTLTGVIGGTARGERGVLDDRLPAELTRGGHDRAHAGYLPRRRCGRGHLHRRRCGRYSAGAQAGRARRRGNSHVGGSELRWVRHGPHRVQGVCKLNIARFMPAEETARVARNFEMRCESLIGERKGCTLDRCRGVRLYQCVTELSRGVCRISPSTADRGAGRGEAQPLSAASSSAFSPGARPRGGRRARSRRRQGQWQARLGARGR